MSRSVRERDFGKVGGLREHIQTLKEMIIYPLLYREVFETHGMSAPRGVLFYGPPGTGKTLVAGAVAAECSKTGRKVSFFRRKGADCLNKYVGESEKQLQHLFQTAQNSRPSIIFFDEIDGLVPTRSDTQDQVHASVVSTLLALMDGLDSQAEVFVIGATNRIDMIDPALRRPGRFDRELYFPLPPLESRVQILNIHTCNWKPRPSSHMVLKLASECVGYCGADLQALCSQAVMESFHRHYPQVSDTSRRYQISMKNIEVLEDDFWAAKEKLIPASQRIYMTPSRPLTVEMEPLLKKTLHLVLDFISCLCPFKFLYPNNSSLFQNKSQSCPRVLIIGKEGNCHTSHIAPAILHSFDHLPVIVIDLASINDYSIRGSESSTLLQKTEEARQAMPSVLYLPDITAWWHLIEENARQILCLTIDKLDSIATTQLFILGTATCSTYDDLPTEVRKIFSKKKCYELIEPSFEERKEFFQQLIISKTLLPPRPVKCAENFPDSLLKEEDNGTEIGRRSRRLRGLDVEYLGISFDNIPKPSYFWNIYSPKLGIKRNPKVFGAEFKAVPRVGVKRRADVSPQNFKRKIPKIELIDDTELSDDSKVDKSKIVLVDHGKLDQLVNRAVHATSRSSLHSLIKLYEGLEIVSIRYSGVLDRTNIIEDFGKEIAVFET